jgi:hypothetical protein
MKKNWVIDLKILSRFQHMGKIQVTEPQKPLLD